MTRRPSGGGRQRLFTQQQKLAIVDLVRANNAIRLNKLQQQILADREVFNNIERVSISTIRRILVKHQITMKQLYRVPFERNSVRVKGLRREYVQVSVTVLYIYNTVLVSSSYSWICAIVSVPHRYIQRGTRYLFDGVGVLYVYYYSWVFWVMPSKLCIACILFCYS